MPADQASPAWQLFYGFLGILSGIAHEVPELAGPGLVALEVEAAYPDVPPGVIPEFEDGPIGARLRQSLPAVLRQEVPELRSVIDRGRGGGIGVAAKFLRESAEDATNAELLKFINYEDGPPPSPASPVTEAPASPQTEAQPAADPRPRFLDALLATVPKDATYEEQAAQREDLKHAFNRRFAAEHGEALKAEMLRRGADARTYEDKLELVRWANEELRRFGLAFSSAKTGVGILAASPAVIEGRFTLKSKAKGEDAKIEYLNIKDIEELVQAITVVEAPPRREALAERIERQGAPRERGRRGR